MPLIPSCLKKRLTLDDPSNPASTIDLADGGDTSEIPLEKSDTNVKPDTGSVPREGSKKRRKMASESPEAGEKASAKKAKKEKKLKNIKSFFGAAKAKPMAKSAASTEKAKRKPAEVDATALEEVKEACKDPIIINSNQVKKDGNKDKADSDEPCVIDVSDEMEVDEDSTKASEKTGQSLLDNEGGDKKEDKKSEKEGKAPSAKENRMLAKLSSFNSPGPRGHKSPIASSRVASGCKTGQGEPEEQKAAEMDEKRKALWDKVSANPNAYYYRYKDPGQEVKKGKWGGDEKEVFLARLKEVGVAAGWGVFSQPIAGRVGYQCASFYRQLIESGDVSDPNYIINDKGKAVYKKQENPSATKAPKASSKKRPKKRDPNAPTKPATPYSLFAKKFCEETKAKQPDLAQKELSSMAGKAWRELPDEEKKVFHEQSESDTKRYEAEMKVYTPPEGYDSAGNLIVIKADVENTEVWTDERLTLLASCILQGHSQSVGAIAAEFKLKVSGVKVSKKSTSEKIHSIAVKEKRPPDSKQIWHLKKEFDSLADDASRNAYRAYRTSIAVKSKPTFDFSGDKRHSKYLKMLKDYEDITLSKMSEAKCLLANAKVTRWIERRKGEPLQEVVEEKHEVDLITQCVQSSTCTRQELVNKIFDKFPEDFITKQAIEDRIILCAERKYYGGKKKSEQLADARFFMWEADNLSIFNKTEAKAIQQRRKDLSRLSGHLKCISRLLNLIETNVDEKNEPKIAQEETKVIRFIRDEECRRQKEKEQNQLKQKKQPKVTLNSFFQKKTSPSTKNKDSDKPRTKASPSSEEIINIENDEDVIDKAIAEGRCEVKLSFKQYQKPPAARVTKEVECLSAPGMGDQVLACKHAKKKLFQFYEDVRPAYFGTFRRTSSIVHGRRPFAHDPSIDDYSYDSGEDWEEPEDGESLASGDEDDEPKELDKLDYKDGWLAGDEEVDYADGKTGDHGVTNEQLRERYSVGVVFNIQASKLPKARNLLRYTIQGLPKLPLILPTVEDILKEMQSAKVTKSKSKEQKPQLSSPVAPASATGPKPKRANTAYMIYQTKNYQSFKAKHSGSTRAEILRIMKAEWKSLPVEQKTEYIQASANDRIRFESELQAMQKAAAEVKTKPQPVTSSISKTTPISKPKAQIAGENTKGADGSKRNLENSTKEANGSVSKKRRIDVSVFDSWKQK